MHAFLCFDLWASTVGAHRDMWQVPLCTLTVIGPEINTEIDANIHSTH
jgi:hypothetical protein